MAGTIITVGIFGSSFAMTLAYGCVISGCDSASCSLDSLSASPGSLSLSSCSLRLPCLQSRSRLSRICRGSLESLSSCFSVSLTVRPIEPKRSFPFPSRLNPIPRFIRRGRSQEGSARRLVSSCHRFSAVSRSKSLVSAELINYALCQLHLHGLLDTLQSRLSV